MINSILAYMKSDDQLCSMIVMIPLTENLLEVIKKAHKIIIDSEKEEFSAIIISNETITSLSFPSEQSQRSFRDDMPGINEAKVVNYALKATEKVEVELCVSKRYVDIRAIDRGDFVYGFGYSIPVAVPISEVIK